jgi:cyclohexanone monooxygenase
MMVSIEQHVDWIVQCITDVTLNGSIEPSEAAEEAWVLHCNDKAEGTMANHPSCSSWYLGANVPYAIQYTHYTLYSIYRYLGANVPGKPRIFMPYIGGVGAYREKCDQVRRDGYEGFVISASR